jgi:hypothetical protein
MKNLFNLVTIIIGATILMGDGAFAQIVGPKQDDVTKTINAEVQLTHERMKNLVSQMGNLKDNPYADATYLALAADFNAKMDVALSHFDSKIQQGVLPKVQYWLNRFSSTVATSQDSNYIMQYHSLIQKEMDTLQSEYNEAIKGIFLEVLGDIPVELNETWRGEANESICGHSEKILPYYYTVDGFKYLSGKSVALPSRFDVCYASYYWGSPNLAIFMRGAESHDYHNTAEDNGVGDYIRHYLKDNGIFDRYLSQFYDLGCNSEPCKSLREADYSQFIILVSSVVDQGLQFSVSQYRFGIQPSRIKPMQMSVLEKK